MEVKIQNKEKSMSEEQETRIRYHSNGRQPRYIPEQSTMAGKKKQNSGSDTFWRDVRFPHFIHLESESAQHPSNWPKILERVSQALHSYSVDSKVLILDGQILHGPSSPLPISKKTGKIRRHRVTKEKGKDRRKWTWITFKVRHFPLENK